MTSRMALKLITHHPSLITHHPSPITRRAGRGQSLVEFALTLPMLCLLLVGIIQIGLIFRAQDSLNAAAHEGARVAATAERVTNGEIAAAVERNRGAIPAGAIVLVAVDPSALGQRQAGQAVTVQVQYDQPVILPGFTALVGSTFSLTAQATFRIPG